MRLGDFNDLEIAREVSIGFYLTSDDGDLLLPEKYRPVGAHVGDVIRVFVYRDSEDRLIASPFSLRAIRVRPARFWIGASKMTCYSPFATSARPCASATACSCTCTSMRLPTA